MVTGAPDDSDLAVFRLLSRDYVKTVAMTVAQKENEGILQLREGGRHHGALRGGSDLGAGMA